MEDVCFSTSYMIESNFSSVNNILTKGEKSTDISSGGELVLNYEHHTNDWTSNEKKKPIRFRKPTESFLDR